MNTAQGSLHSSGTMWWLSVSSRLELSAARLYPATTTTDIACAAGQAWTAGYQCPTLPGKQLTPIG
jgi:hypothetical protein